MKPGVRKNAVHTLFAGKGKGPGRDSGENMFKRGARRHRLVITQAKDMDAVIAVWNDSKDDFQKIATKYANGIRWYAAKRRLNQ